jgi:signal transduction histidine kinase
LSQLGRIELDIESLDMDEMIDEIIKATLYKVKQEGVSITSEHLPDCKGDEKQVNQVFANVIGNAIKYLDPARQGAIKVTGRLEGDMSVYCVEDNGIGIPDKHKDKVFEIFHRVDAKSTVAGEGIGLTAAKQMVGRLGGRIWVESEVGVGSKFFISLPGV